MSKIAGKPDGGTDQGATFSLSIDRAAFLKAVTTASSATEKRSTIPILSYVKLVVSDGTIVVLGTNLDTEISAEAEAEGQGSTCVPALRLRDVLKAMTGIETVTMAGASNGRVTLSADKVDATFMTLPASDFPLIAYGDQKWSVALPEGVSAFLIGGAADVMSTEETRYYLNGVCFEVDGGVARATATDGHRLISRTSNLEGCAANVERLIIPREAVKRLLDVVRRREATISGFTNAARGYVEIACGSSIVRTKTVDGTFPDWRRVVPDDEGALMEIGVGDLRRSLAMAKANSDHRSRPVKLCIGSGEIKVTSKSADEGSIAAAVPCSITGEMTDFGVNGIYLDEMAASMERMGSRTMTLRMQSPGAPLKIMPDPAIVGSVAVLMPMRV